MKNSYHLIYHSEQKTHRPSRERVAYLLKAARSRGLRARPRKFVTGDILLPDCATLFLQRPTQAATKA